MLTTLPRDPHVYLHWDWNQFNPLFDDLLKRPLAASSLETWLADWSDVSRLISEIYTRLWIATSQNTADQQAIKRYNTYLDETFTPSQAANQALKKKLLASGLQPPEFEVALH